MCKKIVISLNDVNGDNLVTNKEIEKFKKNIRVIVDSSHKAVIFKDYVVKEVLSMGEYKPFSNLDKNHELIIKYVNMNKSKIFAFTTRTSQIRDSISKVIYNASFSGGFTFCVRNERKFLGTAFLANNDCSQNDFVNHIENEINSVVFSNIVNFFASKNISFKEYLKYKEKLEEYVLINLDKYLDDAFGVSVRTLKLNEMNILDIMHI